MTDPWQLALDTFDDQDNSELVLTEGQRAELVIVAEPVIFPATFNQDRRRWQVDPGRKSSVLRALLRTFVVRVTYGPSSDIYSLPELSETQKLWFVDEATFRILCHRRKTSPFEDFTFQVSPYNISSDGFSCSFEILTRSRIDPSLRRKISEQSMLPLPPWARKSE